MRSFQFLDDPGLGYQPYLIRPIADRQAELATGWLYQHKGEREIHGMYRHRGLDWNVPYGTPVQAAAAGYAVAGHQQFALLNPDKTLRLWQNKPIGMGFGYFVQIYHPERVSSVPGGRMTQYAHLASISPKLTVRVTPPLEIDITKKIVTKNSNRRHHKWDDNKMRRVIAEQQKLIKRYPWVTKRWGVQYTPDIETMESYFFPFSKLSRLAQQTPWVRWVEQGEVIGTVGTSGLSWGNDTYPKAEEHPDIRPFSSPFPPHLHFEEATRDAQRFKVQQRDPYGLYMTIKWYTNAEPLLFLA